MCYVWRLGRHRQLLGGTHDYDGRRILKRRKSLEKRAAQPAATGGGGGKGAGGGGAEEDEDEEGKHAARCTCALLRRHCRIVALHHQRVAQLVTVAYTPVWLPSELSGVESDTALTTTGRKSIAVRHWRDVEQDNLRMKVGR